MSRVVRGLAFAVAVSLVVVVVVGLATARRPPADRASALAARLRCPVCQSVSVADSASETAQAMRDRIQELVAQGRTDDEILDWFVERYGEWVLLDPPRRGHTLLLWLLPPLAFLGGAAVLMSYRRRRPPAPLSADQRAAVHRELARLGPGEEA